MNNIQPLHIFGEVLFDHFPDGSYALGGAPFNVAWHLQAFGQVPRFISRIGDDLSGHEVAALMEAWDMTWDALQTDNEHPTGSVEVLLQDGEPSYAIMADCAYDFIDGEALGQKPTQGILYHGSLALRNPVSCAALQAIKARHLGKIFIDVNLRAPWWERETLFALLHDADWIKLNIDELSMLFPEYSAPEAAMQAFCAQFNPEILIVTCGAEGAIACDRQQQFFHVKPSGSIAVVDAVGAGDAFAAVLLLGLNWHWSMQETLERAQAFASAMIGRRGATVANIGFYRLFCKQWGLL